jgi:acetoacetate decarboxylase
MATNRYGARPPEQQRNREMEAVSAPIWSTALTIVFETDPDVVRDVLPQPLEPTDAVARIRFASVNMGGIPVFGAGWFGVRGRHGRVEGEYPLFMPMSTEQATVGGRETFGEPKKIGGVTVETEGDSVRGRFERMGFTLAEFAGTLGDEVDIAPKDKVDFYFKCSPSPDGKGFDTEPALVHVRRHEEARNGRAVDGTLTLGGSPVDPLGDIPIGRMISMELAEVTTNQEAEVVERVPGDWLLPFVHQRYDDLSVLGAKEK